MAGDPFFFESNPDINRFVKVEYMTLCSSGFVPLQRLESNYIAMHSCIHEKAESAEIDVAALTYVYHRLPICIFSVRKVLFGQSETYLQECGIPLGQWKEVFADARRRRYLYDGKETLIAFIASKSDLDDVVPALLTLQIEWNKIYRLGVEHKGQLDESLMTSLKSLFGANADSILQTIQTHPCDLAVRNYEASYCRYLKETETWWGHISDAYPDLEHHPVYFVSSNTHSLINVLSGFPQTIEKEILDYAWQEPALERMAGLYLSTTTTKREQSNILYFLLMKYEMSTPKKHQELLERRMSWENKLGICRISSTKTLDVTTQIINLRKIAQALRSGNVGFPIPSGLEESDAVILNIDYPLGRTAYFILDKIAEHVDTVKGVYVIGKAASLFADRGDILLPSFIADQHTHNQYYFKNCITPEDIVPYLGNPNHGVYDNQKAVTVLGTFLQNKQLLHDLLMSGIMDIEMEAGPYLSALYEIIHAKRYPERETIMLDTHAIDLGIIHYVSDNPLEKAKLSTSLAADGIDATYASTLAVLGKILHKEAQSHA